MMRTQTVIKNCVAWFNLTPPPPDMIKVEWFRTESKFWLNCREQDGVAVTRVDLAAPWHLLGTGTVANPDHTL